MPAGFHEAAEAVNDGERLVLSLLRDELDDHWYVVGNFEFSAEGGRWYECDAVAISDAGYGFLIETKWWAGGVIEGNDRQWMLPARPDAERVGRQPPIHVATGKVKKLASFIHRHLPAATQLKLLPLVVVVTEHEPQLEGKSAQTTVTHLGLIERLQQDPRTPDQIRSAAVPLGVAPAVFDYLTQNTRPIAENVLGDYVLDELDELRADGTEVWLAHPAAHPERRCRLKRYTFDTLGHGEAAQRQAARAHHDFRAVAELEPGLATPLWGPPVDTDGELVVVSEWPKGESIAELVLNEALTPDEARDCVMEVFATLARVHRQGVVHRNLRPQNVFVLSSGRVQLSDFELARVPGLPGVTAIATDSVDDEYAAPEVVRDPSEASPRSDVYSLARVASELLDASHVPEDDLIRGVLATSRAVDAALRPGDGDAVLQRLRGGAVQVDVFEVGDILDDRWVVRSRHEGGGLTIVYRLFDSITDAEYSGKFVRPEYRQRVDVLKEFQVLGAMPPHDNVVQPRLVERVERVRRGRTTLVHEETFLLSDWVEARSLDEFVATREPVARVLAIGHDILAALTHLHAHEIIHRDIKPENVLVTPSGRARVLDFNVSTATIDAGSTQLGTPHYRAPEVLTSGWTASADVFSAGVVLVELLAGERLGRDGVHEFLSSSLDVPVQVRDVLERLVEHDPTRRPSAADALDRWSRIHLLPPPPVAGEPPPMDSEPNCNPYAERLVSFFSQSSVSNAGTRGLDLFGEWLYVPTSIDEELRPRIESGELSLVLISGNAGDGKTAFIRKLEAQLRSRAGAVADTTHGGNGSVIRFDGRTVATNWDGSQDQGGTANDDVLRQFLERFAGDVTRPPADETYVIAINEGRLLDFLEGNREQFGALEHAVGQLFAGAHVDAPGWLAVVNLNRRAITADTPSRVVPRLLDRMADSRLWQPCESCVARDLCPSRANAARLRDPVHGPRAIERIRQVLDVVRLRRRLHITMRDLLSALAYTVVGNRTCAEIVTAVEDEDWTYLLRGQLYSALFGAVLEGGDGADRDRLLTEVGILDVADVARPERDGDLWALGIDALQNFTPSPDEAVIRKMYALGSEHQKLGHDALKRKVFLEADDPEPLAALPYDHLRSFLMALRGELDGLTDRVGEAITISEGLRADHDLVAVRVVDDLDAEDRSYVTRPTHEFVAAVRDERAQARFIEYAPEVVSYSSREDPNLVLDLDVDVHEALMRMRDGFTPSREDLRGSWLSLASFKERLASKPSRELYLRSGAGTATWIRVDEANRITAETVG